MSRMLENNVKRAIRKKFQFVGFQGVVKCFWSYLNEVWVRILEENFVFYRDNSFWVVRIGKLDEQRISMVFEVKFSKKYVFEVSIQKYWFREGKYGFFVVLKFGNVLVFDVLFVVIV